MDTVEEEQKEAKRIMDMALGVASEPRIPIVETLIKEVPSKRPAFEIINSLVLRNIKVIYGQGKELPGILDPSFHGMIYVIAAYFKTDEGEVLIGYPGFTGNVEFANHLISGKYTIFGKD